MKIQRYIVADILKKLKKFQKAILIYGPRQVGKTTLCKEIIRNLNLKTLEIDADFSRYASVLSSRDDRKLKELVAGYELLFIDEAQRIPNIGINLKILIDHHPSLKIIATGSSSFELANKISEPLTGRKWIYHLYPISQLELRTHFNPFELKSQLEERLIWGSYPELFTIEGREFKEDYLRELCSDYLYKDVLALNEVRHSEKIKKLVQLLAFQIGQEVSLQELSNRLEIAKETVARYIDLLEKTFIIFSRGGFSRNLRREITKTRKYYFYDLGIRNGLIDDFHWLDNRNDTGMLWENFLMSERLKRNHYLKQGGNGYFWRNYSGAEIDYIEEREGKLWAFEFKWKDKKTKAPQAWREAYPSTKFKAIHQDNWIDFVI